MLIIYNFKEVMYEKACFSNSISYRAYHVYGP